MAAASPLPNAGDAARRDPTRRDSEAMAGPLGASDPVGGLPVPLRSALDPELHTLRTLARALPDRHARHDLESARYNLYAALEAGTWPTAIRWCHSLEAAIHAHLSDSAETRAL